MGGMGGMGADGRYAGRLDPATSRGNRQKKKKKELIIKEIKEEPYGKRKEGFYNNVITCA